MRVPLDNPPGFVPVFRIVAVYAIPFAFGWLLFLQKDLLEVLIRRAWLYAALAGFFADEKKHQAERPESPALKDLEVFQLLVFFLRFGRLRSNGRPRTRAFRPSWNCFTW